MLSLSEQDDHWHIEAYAPSWMDVESIHLVIENGVEVSSWSFDNETHVSASFPKEETAWVLAEIRGAHWAISPIHISTED